MVAEDIADDLAGVVRMVGQVLLVIPIVVGDKDEHLPFRENIEVIGLVSFDILSVPGLQSLSALYKLSNVLIQLVIGIKVSPELLSILRIVASAVALLGSVVHNRNTSLEHVKGKIVFESGVATVSVEEPRVVVVITEQPQGIGVSELLVNRVQRRPDLHTRIAVGKYT